VTTDEIVLFATGIALGVQGMTLLHMWWDMRDARRSERASRAIAKGAAGDQFMSSFRLYRLRAQREVRR